MKKLFILLLLPLNLLAQNSVATWWGSSDYTDGVKATWEFLGTTADASTQLSNVKSGDTIVMAIDLSNARYGNNEVRYFHIDVNNNTDLLTMVSEEFQNQPSDAQTSISLNTGVKFTKAGDASRRHQLDWQWTGGGTYENGTSWNVTHYQGQTVNGAYGGANGHFIKIKYKVNDVPDTFDFTVPSLTLMMARANDPQSGWTFQWGGGVLSNPKGDFTIKTDNNTYAQGAELVYNFNNLDPSNYKGTLYTKVEANTWGANQQFTIPSDGKVDLSTYTIIQGEEYAVALHANSGTAFRTKYDDIVTVSDAALLFKSLGESGLNHNSLNTNLPTAIQISNGDFNYDGKVTEEDTYALLAHVLDVNLIENYIANGAYAANSGQNLYYGVLGAYNATQYAKVNSGNTAAGILGGHLAEIDFDFTTTNQSIPLYVSIKGDVNMSHSWVINGQNTLSSRSNSTNKNSLKQATGSFVTELVDGKVIVTIQLPIEIDLAAAQVKLRYDTEKLIFDQAEIDTGNTTTNFAKHTKGYLNIGGINLEKTKIENGTIKITFSPIVTITNTIGLVSITNSDAADMDAERVNLKLQ